MSKVQEALVKRVDSLEKALLAVKNLHQMGTRQNAQHARNRALAARIGLLEKELQDVKAQKEATSIEAVSSNTAEASELAKMKQALKKDAAIEQNAVQGAAAVEKAEYSSLTLAKKKAHAA